MSLPAWNVIADLWPEPQVNFHPTFPPGQDWSHFSLTEGGLEGERIISMTVFSHVLPWR